MTQCTCRPVPPQVRLARIKQRRFGRALNRAYLAGFEKRYKQGHKDALLDVVDGCLRTGRKVPLWAAQLFCDCYLDFADGRVQTLHDAFGVASNRRTLNTRKRHNRLRPLVVHRVIQLNTADRKENPIGGGLFAKVGKELGASASTVSRLYYDKAGKLLQKLFTRATLS